MDAPRPVARPTDRPVVVPQRVLVDALTALAGAATRLDVGEAVLPLLLELPGVRAAALVEGAGAHVVVQGSAGYDCGTMAVGQLLPLDAGLPVTEAVRTSRLVVRGAGPSWVAAPFRRRGTGALLLSLHAPPPDDCGPLVALASAVGQALQRVRTTEGRLADLAALERGTAPGLDPALDVAVRTRPLQGAVGGDVLLSLPDERGGSWLVAADVCGSGVAAAVVGQSVAAAVRALAPYAGGPAELLHDLERSLRPSVGPGSFVTAVVVRLTADRAIAASAGHPPPLLLSQSEVTVLPVPAGLPLALETGPDRAYEAVEVDLPAGALLLLHTDGLTDREGAHDTEPLALLRGVAPGEPAAVAAQVLAAAERAGPATDDVALLVVRRAGPPATA